MINKHTNTKLNHIKQPPTQKKNTHTHKHNKTIDTKTLQNHPLWGEQMLRERERESEREREKEREKASHR